MAVFIVITPKNNIFSNLSVVAINAAKTKFIALKKVKILEKIISFVVL